MGHLQQGQWGRTCFWREETWGRGTFLLALGDTCPALNQYLVFWSSVHPICPGCWKSLWKTLGIFPYLWQTGSLGQKSVYCLLIVFSSFQQPQEPAWMHPSCHVRPKHVEPIFRNPQCSLNKNSWNSPPFFFPFFLHGCHRNPQCHLQSSIQQAFSQCSV